MLRERSAVWTRKDCGLGRNVSFVEVREQSWSCLYEKAVTLWLANSITLISAPLMGQNDAAGASLEQESS